MKKTQNTEVKTLFRDIFSLICKQGLEDVTAASCVHADMYSEIHDMTAFSAAARSASYL